MGIQRILPEADQTLVLAVFSLVFFAAVLFFSLRPGQILTWIGKILNPLFLCLLGILVIRALISPMGNPWILRLQAPTKGRLFPPAFWKAIIPWMPWRAWPSASSWSTRSGISGVKEPGEVAKQTVRAGIFSSLLMALIYVLVTLIGAQSRGIFEASSNGGEALAQIAEHYFGRAGALILAGTVTVACLKTAVGLITSCGETFVRIFPKGPSYRFWAAAFCVLSFLIANLGLDAIIAYSMPVLMFLYPLAIVLILLTLCGKFFPAGPNSSSLDHRLYLRCRRAGPAADSAGGNQKFLPSERISESGFRDASPDETGIRMGLPGSGGAGRGTAAVWEKKTQPF